MKLMQRTRNIVISACKYAIHKNTDKYVENILKIATFNYIQQDKPSKLESLKLLHNEVWQIYKDIQ